MRIAFIGGGNMATALISGLIRSGTRPDEIHVSEPNELARHRLQAEFSVHAHAGAKAAIKTVEVIVLAVKPQVMPVVLNELANAVKAEQLLISIAAGIEIATIQAALGPQQPVVRAMPNTPALIGKGVTGLYASPGCTAAQRKSTEAILSATGGTSWVDRESLINVVTAVSGSGPAYYFLLTEALREAGQSLGLPEDTAADLALQTAYGAGAMARESGVDVAELRKRVTSPGGTTQAALEVFEKGRFRELVMAAVSAATDRGVELARDADKS